MHEYTSPVTLNQETFNESDLIKETAAKGCGLLTSSQRTKCGYSKESTATTASRQPDSQQCMLHKGHQKSKDNANCA
jgi:hypothetical protein